MNSAVNPFLSMAWLTVDSWALGLKGQHMSRETREHSVKPFISLFLTMFVENLASFDFSR